ncbi:cupin domain-containing protein [Legionella gresilensis]|uniref:cupin domain-containing protein n=1 Tax=Legionella gresilensis TaxID=91823 RepID=UPI00104141D8|nr:cupin domain-containing protein [Legionella gresilensis]
MSELHKMLQAIPHERVQSQYVKVNEQFELLKLGIFNVEKSILTAISETTSDTNEIVELVRLKARSKYQPHYHKQSCAVIYMILGEGLFLLGKNEVSYQPGMRFDLPEKTPHGFLTDTETLFLSIQTPPIRNYQTGEVDLYYAE